MMTLIGATVTRQEVKDTTFAGGVLIATNQDLYAVAM
jgi:hypothetical protein